MIINGAAYGQDATYNAVRLAASLAKREQVTLQVFLMGDGVTVAHTVADTIIAAIARRPSPARFDSHGGCFIETGPGVTLRHPVRRWHWSKVAFERQVMRRWL